VRIEPEPKIMFLWSTYKRLEEEDDLRTREGFSCSFFQNQCKTCMLNDSVKMDQVIRK